MNYWLICLPRADMEHCIKKGIFGLPRKTHIGKVRQGDKIVCCAGAGDWKIIALGEATSDYYMDDSKVFLKEGLFVDRFNFDARKITDELDLRSLMDRLSFITNVGFWAVYFRNGIARLSKEDWKLIENSCTKSRMQSNA